MAANAHAEGYKLPFEKAGHIYGKDREKYDYDHASAQILKH